MTTFSTFLKVSCIHIVSMKRKLTFTHTWSWWTWACWNYNITFQIKKVLVMVSRMRKPFGISAWSFCILKPSVNVLKLADIPIIIYTTFHIFQFWFPHCRNHKESYIKVSAEWKLTNTCWINIIIICGNYTWNFIIHVITKIDIHIW